MLAPDSEEAKRIDAALKVWRQGDLALEERWFVHVGDPARALSEAAAEAAGEGVQALTTEVAGLVVLTQTCDIVRSCTVKPYVEVAPLVAVSAEALHQVKRGRRPAHATLPALVGASLVADLDRVMTIEKSIVAAWSRTPGYTADADGRSFAQALARKRVRFAFPDDFTDFVAKLHDRIRDKHGKVTDEGHGLRALREIRVQATPYWDAAQVDIFFWFLRDNDHAATSGRNWADFMKAWLNLVPAKGRYQSVNGQVAALDDMTAAEYVGSDPLDLDHLTGSPT